MVHRTSSRGETVDVRLISLVVAGILVLVLSFLTMAVGVYRGSKAENYEEGGLAGGTEASEILDESAEELETGGLTTEISRVDFQPVIDAWTSNLGGTKSVLIYDLEREEVAGSYNIGQTYNTASLYKLFVVYEGYRRISDGRWDGAETVRGTGKTTLECLDLAIRESHSPCAEGLWAMVGQAELDRIISEEYRILNSRISGLSSNVSDVAAIMRRFYEHPEIAGETEIARMFDSFLNQPATTYNWRQGLPSGFSGQVKVYNKVGWDWNGKSWNVYHDAAIVEFPVEKRHFIVVVMTSRVPYSAIKSLGAQIEATFREQNAAQ